LFERGSRRISLIFHTQRVVSASGGRYDVGSLLRGMIVVHTPVIHRAA
jgi:hypothetical protein